MADLSLDLLPDVVWVRIMSHLSLKDRSSVSQTCHALHDIFQHPSLWYSACVQLLGATDMYKKIPIMKPDQYLQMINRFGLYIQDLTLLFRGYAKKIPDDVREVIELLTENSRFETLHLEVSSIITHKELSVYYGKRKTDLDILGELVRKAYRLKSFTLAAWPIYRGLYSVDILETLTQNDKVKETLQKLSLFWLEPHRSTWATLNMILPSPEQVIHTLGHFTNLRSLHLRSSMINNDVIAEMAKTSSVRLESLGILITYDRHAKKKSLPMLPEIRSSTWLKLAQRCPGLKVEINVVTRIPYIELAGLLKPEIPVSAISFMKYAECSAISLQSIIDKYGHTLQAFVNYSECTETTDDELLVSLVRQSPQLNNFLHAGAVSKDAVTTIASLRGARWQTLQFNSRNIVTQQISEEDYDPDVIVQQTEEGGFCLARHQYELSMQSEEEREAALESLIQHVAQTLEKPWWQPMDRREGFTFPDDDVATWVASPKVIGLAGR